MKKVGEEAKRKYDTLQEMQRIQRQKEGSTMSLLNTKLRGRENVFDEFVVNAVMLSHGLDKAEAESFIEQYMHDWTPPSSLTISVKVVDDIWKNKWGKEFKTKRIALVYPYNPDFNSALKQHLTFHRLSLMGQVNCGLFLTVKMYLTKQYKLEVRVVSLMILSNRCKVNIPSHLLRL